MCKYCDVNNYTNDEYGTYSILSSSKNISLEIYFDEKSKTFGIDALIDDDATGITVNYCPMCGRKLVDE